MKQGPEPIEDDAVETREVLDVVELGDVAYALVLIGEDGDPANAVGNVYLIPKDPDASREPVLWTNDRLRVLDVSPTGSLWVASSDGNVLTTAKVKWAMPTDTELQFESLAKTPKWRATTLPPLRRKGYAPSITALAIVDDAKAYAGTFTGSIYEWNGVNWAEVFDSAPGSIHRLLALGDGKVIAIGAHSTIVYCDGTAWKRLRDPDAKAEADISGAVALDNGTVLLCDQSGRLLQGGANGFAVLSRHDLSFFAMDRLGARILVAAGPDGVAELVDGVVTILKPNVEAVTVRAGLRKAYFVEAAPEGAGFVDYDPKEPGSAWNETPL